MARTRPWKRLRIFLPEDDAARMCRMLEQFGDQLDREGLALGRFGAYRHVRNITPVAGHYLPDPAAKPYLVTPPKSVCIETWMEPEIESRVLEAIAALHPYEYPLIEVSDVRMLDPEATE